MTSNNLKLHKSFCFFILNRLINIFKENITIVIFILQQNISHKALKMLDHN